MKQTEREIKRRGNTLRDREGTNIVEIIWKILMGIKWFV